MSNAHLFRTFNRQQDAMTRAAMPRTSAADPVTLPTFATDRPTGARWSGGRKLVQKEAFTLAEVAHA